MSESRTAVRSRIVKQGVTAAKIAATLARRLQKEEK